MGRPPKQVPSELSELLRQIGGNVAIFRQEQGLSQTELAKKAKISLTTLNEIETRQFRDIRLSTLSAIAQALDVSVVLLLDRSEILDLPRKEQIQLLKASESLHRIIRRLKTKE